MPSFTQPFLMERSLFCVYNQVQHYECFATIWMCVLLSFVQFFALRLQDRQSTQSSWRDRGGSQKEAITTGFSSGLWVWPLRTSRNTFAISIGQTTYASFRAYSDLTSQTWNDLRRLHLSLQIAVKNNSCTSKLNTKLLYTHFVQ